jgi:hypothetical protein
MRKVTAQVVGAFLGRLSCCVGNSHTDGQALYLHGNKIARRTDAGGIEISHAGWATRTTKERLNAIPNVYINQKGGVWHLNGVIWDGDWTAV